MKRTAGAIVSALVLGLAPAAVAHDSQKASDHTVARADSRGDVTNRLDLKGASFNGNGDGTATLTIRTWKRWGCSYLNRSLVDGGGVASLRWAVNKDRDRYSERDAFFDCHQGKFTLYWTKDHDDRYAFSASRSNRRNLSVTLPLKRLGLDDRSRLTFTALSFANGKFGDKVYFEETDDAPPLAPLTSPH